MASVGLDVPAFSSSPVDFYARFADSASQAGFRNLWVGDHLLWHQPRFEQFTLLGMLCGITDLTLGTGITLAPLRQPWWTAKSGATLQAASRGGFILGLGSGGEYPREFALAGVRSEERGSSVARTVEFCRRAWAGEEGADFSPLPSAPVPVLLAGRKPAALTRAAALADGWLGIFLDPTQFAAARTLLLAEASRLGRRTPATAMTVWVCADREQAVARQIASSVIADEYGMPGASFERHVVTGTPDDVAGSLAEFAAAGADHLDLHIAHPDPLAQIELWGRVVTERLAAVSGPAHPIFRKS